MNTPLFYSAMSNIPKCDLEKLKEYAPDMDEYEARKILVLNRWQNPICNSCLDKSNPQKLKLCDKCFLTFYCSAECYKKDFENHKKRCCNPEGCLDTGPMELAFLKIK